MRSGFALHHVPMLMSLPKPYSLLNTDKIKKWHKELVAGNEVGADDEDEQEFFNSIHFTNAFVLKINQLVKQVCTNIQCYKTI